MTLAGYLAAGGAQDEEPKPPRRHAAAADARDRRWRARCAQGQPVAETCVRAPLLPAAGPVVPRGPCRPGRRFGQPPSTFAFAASGRRRGEQSRAVGPDSRRARVGARRGSAAVGKENAATPSKKSRSTRSGKGGTPRVSPAARLPPTLPRQLQHEVLGPKTCGCAPCVVVRLPRAMGGGNRDHPAHRSTTTSILAQCGDHAAKPESAPKGRFLIARIREFLWRTR